MATKSFIKTERSLWKGTLSVGLLNVPIKLCTAVSENQVSFKQFLPYERTEKQGRKKVKVTEYAPVNYHRVVKCLDDDGVEYERRIDELDQLVKGFDNGDATYTFLTPDELESCQAVQHKTVSIQQFVPLGQVPSIMFDKPYYVWPDAAGERAYALLIEAMRAEGVAAVGTFVMRSKEYVSYISVDGNKLVMQIVYYPDEIKPTTDTEAQIEQLEVNEQELNLARQLIKSSTSDFDASLYHNRVADNIMSLIASKQSETPLTLIDAGQERKATPDLIAALEASLGERKAS